MKTAEFMHKDKPIGIIGASTKPDSFGYKVFSDLNKAGFKVIPINQKYEEIDGVKCYSSLDKVKGKLHSIDIITPPAVTTEIVKQAIELGIKNIWMQPGAESSEAIKLCEEKGVNAVYKRCIMVDRRLNLHHDPFEEIIDGITEYDSDGHPIKSIDVIGQYYGE